MSNVYLVPLTEMQGMQWYSIELGVQQGMGAGYGIITLEVIEGGIVNQQCVDLHYYNFALPTIPSDNIVLKVLTQT